MTEESLPCLPPQTGTHREAGAVYTLRLGLPEGRAGLPLRQWLPEGKAISPCRLGLPDVKPLYHYTMVVVLQKHCIYTFSLQKVIYP